MEVSVEISMYPLTPDYAPVIDGFILKLKANVALKVLVNGMSTQVFGPLDVLWPALGEAMQSGWEKEKVMFILKAGKGTLMPDGVPEYLQ